MHTAGLSVDFQMGGRRYFEDKFTKPILKFSSNQFVQACLLLIYNLNVMVNTILSIHLY